LAFGPQGRLGPQGAAFLVLGAQGLEVRPSWAMVAGAVTPAETARAMAAALRAISAFMVRGMRCTP
jgi:hypothetical protein